MFYTYVIWNRIRGKIYIGHTENLESRLKRHNGLLKNKKKSFTNKNKGDGTWELVYNEVFKIRAEAMRREKELKSARGRKFIRDIIDKL